MAGLIPKKDALNQFGMQTITVLMIITLVLVIMMEVSVYSRVFLQRQIWIVNYYVRKIIRKSQ